ncbi:MAG: hypothetical protein JSV37_10215 [Anaerolineaceae bacterium]|nr:MAG: hypothetical protein JSV37_10215 [Anaerolineaceae bacterium]
MYDAEYFLSGLKRQVDEAGGDAIVTLVLHSRESFYVRDVVKTHPGYVMLNVWHGQDGRPIKAPSSEAYSQEYPEGYHPISVSFESISMIDVLPTSADERRRIGFNTK